MLDLGDVAAHPDPGDHRAEQVEPDDATVDLGMEVGHGERKFVYLPGVFAGRLTQS